MMILLCLFFVLLATSCDQNDSNPDDTEPKDTSTSLENVENSDNNEPNDNSNDTNQKTDESNQNSSNSSNNTNQSNQSNQNSSDSTDNTDQSNDSNQESNESNQGSSDSIDNTDQSNDSNQESNESNQGSSDSTDNTDQSNDTNQDSSNTTNNNDQNDQIEEEEDGGGDGESPSLTISDYYSLMAGSAFLKVEITNVYDGVFWDNSSVPTTQYILVEGMIKDDLYNGGLRIGETVIIPIGINVSVKENGEVSRKKLDAEAVKNWLSSVDGLYVNTSFCLATYVNIDDDSSRIQMKYRHCALTPDKIIPYVDDTVRIALLCDFLEENYIIYSSPEEIQGMDSFCYDGISCENFENNIGTLFDHGEDESGEDIP